jgi:hypothetical protein
VEMKIYIFVRFQVLKASSMKMVVFWDVTPCSLVDVNRRFRGAYCLQHPDDGDSKFMRAMIITLIMEVGSTSETSVNFYHTTRRNSPEYSHLQ